MTPQPGALPPAPTQRRRATTEALLLLARPLLAISFALYRVEVRRNLYPRDAPVTQIEGVDPQGLLFAGDIAVAGHGVLSHGLTVAAQASYGIAAASDRGAHLTMISQTDLTMAELAARPRYGADGVEIAFLMLGIPDVLLATRSEKWAADLRVVAERIRSESQFRAVRIVVSGIPPLSDFRAIRPAVRRIIDRQVERLNAVSQEVAASTPGMVFVPFPTWRLGDMYVNRLFSWKTLHEVWAEALAAAVAPR